MINNNDIIIIIIYIYSIYIISVPIQTEGDFRLSRLLTLQGNSCQNLQHVTAIWPCYKMWYTSKTLLSLLSKENEEAHLDGQMLITHHGFTASFTELKRPQKSLCQFYRKSKDTVFFIYPSTIKRLL